MDPPTFINKKQPLLRCYSKQMGGHGQDKGSNKPGMVKHEDGSLLKPLLPPPRGPREASFYKLVDKSEEEILKSMKPFLPTFHGVETLDWGGKEMQFMKIEDVTARFENPCIIDLKIGSRTYDPEATPEKIKSESTKYLGTKEMGFSVPGLRVYDLSTCEVIRHGKEFGKVLKAEDVKNAFAMFLNMEYADVRDLIQSFLLKLKRIEAWFLKQRKYAFYASSILLVYDALTLNAKDHQNKGESAKDSCNGGSKGITFKRPLSPNDGAAKATKKLAAVKEEPSETESIAGTAEAQKPKDESSPLELLTEVRMIDFAHVFPTEERDDNYLKGLQTIIGIFQNLLDDCTKGE